MLTIETLKTDFPVGNLDHLIEDVEIPVLTGPNPQGDLSWYPIREGNVAGLKPIPREGVVILAGNNGHPHTLFSMTGECLYAPNTQRGQRLGTVVVPEGAVLLVGHNEHRYHAVGAGTYIFNRSREMRDEIRMLAD